MKKVMIIMVFVVMVLNAFSQVRIGYTENEIKQEFEDNGFYRVNDEHGDKSLMSTFKRALVLYYFTGEITTAVAILPYNLAEYNFYRRQYDQLYIRTSKNKWKAMLNDHPFVIEIRKGVDGSKYFYWAPDFSREDEAGK